MRPGCRPPNGPDRQRRSRWSTSLAQPAGHAWHIAGCCAPDCAEPDGQTTAAHTGSPCARDDAAGSSEGSWRAPSIAAVRRLRACSRMRRIISAVRSVRACAGSASHAGTAPGEQLAGAANRSGCRAVPGRSRRLCRMALSPTLLPSIGECARNHRSRRQRDRAGAAADVVQQHPQSLQRIQCRNRRFGQPHWRAERSIEHPGRELQISTEGLLRQGAAENIRAALPYHLMDADNLSRPRMPVIRDCPFLNPVGVLSSRSTTRCGRTRRWRTGRRWRSGATLSHPNLRHLSGPATG